MINKEFLFSIITGMIAVMLIGTSCFIWASEKEVPEGLIGLDGVVCTFFFVQTGNLRKNGNGNGSHSNGNSPSVST